MPRSSRTKTSWFSDSEHGPRPSTRGGEPLVELDDVSLRFTIYHEKSYSLKRAAIDFLLRRENTAPVTQFWALRNLSLRVNRGDRLAIVGSNGAGKSTLLRVLARIYPPTAGRVAVRGAIAPLIEMGAGFNAELSGSENILLNGAMLGFSRKSMLERVDRIYDFSGLREFADLPLKYYSSGMYSRLAFAIATEVDPDVLIVDEVLSAGDAAFMEKAKQRMHSLFERAGAVIVVSHDMPTLRELCTRGLWLQKGTLRADGPIDEVIDQYLEATAPAAA